MNLGQLQTAVYQVCGYPTPVQPIVVQRVKNWINEAHRHCLRLPGLVELRQRSGFRFTSVAGQTVYAMPFAFERIDAVVERTSQRRLRNISRDVFRSIDPAETSTGTPTCYIPEGWQPRFAVPTIPNAFVWVVGAYPQDTGQTVRVSSIRGFSAATGDIRVEETATLAGLTPVRVSPHGDHVDLVSFTLSSAVDGYVSLYQGTEFAMGTLELSRISAGSTSAQFWCVRLWPTPSGAVTYYVDGQIEIPDLLNETDIPLLPPSYHGVLAAFARMREYERLGDSRFAVAAAEWERGLGQMRAFVNFPDDWKPVAGSMSSGLTRTNLGGDFPADWGWP